MQTAGCRLINTVLRTVKTLFLQENGIEILKKVQK